MEVSSVPAGSGDFPAAEVTRITLAPARAVEETCFLTRAHIGM
jgi:hypothetical protein